MEILAKAQYMKGANNRTQGVNSKQNLWSFDHNPDKFLS